MPASLLAVTVILNKVTVVIGCKGLKLKSTMRGFQRFNILICLFSSISSIHAKDIHNTSGRKVCNFSAKHARNECEFIQEPKTSSESLEKYLNKIE